MKVLRQECIKIQDWLKSYITTAFANVTLDGGVDIHTAKFRDSYCFDIEEQRRAAGCERSDWRNVDPHLLRDRAWVLPFLDANGFRFYLPVMMIDIIENERGSDLPDTLFCNLKIDVNGLFKDHPFTNVFNRSQRAAIVRFLKFLIHNRGWRPDGEAGKLLKRLKQR